MRIALRTSGGRGEYELAGSHGLYSITALLGRELQIEVLPQHLLRTGNIARDAQGKPRLRLVTQEWSHIYLVLAGALLLAKPKRAIGETNTGKLQLIDNGYAITTIQIDVVRQLPGEASHIRPTTFAVGNAGGEEQEVSVVDRLAQVQELWVAAEESLETDEAAPLLIAHRDALASGDARQVLVAARDLRALVDGDEDPLRFFVRRFGLATAETYTAGITQGIAAEFHADDDHRNQTESAQDFTRSWRRIKLRGAAGERFRTAIGRVYNHTCLFTGYRLPRISLTGSAGVDAAHVLPWATHNNHAIDNGICLNKLCHWAFDAGLIRMAFVEAQDRYKLWLPDAALEAESDGKIDLSAFHPIVGEIPPDRLPENREHWPSPVYLQRYNSLFES